MSPAKTGAHTVTPWLQGLRQLIPELAICSAGSLTGMDLCLIFAPLKGYDEPEILPSSTRKICLIGADAGHIRMREKPTGRPTASPALG